MAPAVIEARGLTKHFGELEAVRAVDLEVAAGDVFAFLGPNGAGKSTTISMLCTLIKPTSGTAKVGGFDVVHQQGEVRSRIGLVFQDPLAVPLEALITLLFGAVLLSLGIVGFRRSD